MFDKTIINEYPNMIEVCDYDPNKDVLAIFVGSENDIPPIEVIEEIKTMLENIEQCKLIVAPGVFRMILLKGGRK